MAFKALAFLLTNLVLALFLLTGNATVIVELLLKAGADLNAITAWGDTAAHYAALSGTVEHLQYLVEAGITLTKSPGLASEAWRLCSKFGLPAEDEEAMNYNLLQKVAKSSCLNKSIYLMEQMMKVRQKVRTNECMPLHSSSLGGLRRNGVFTHQELNQQETEFLMLSHVCNSRTSWSKHSGFCP